MSITEFDNENYVQGAFLERAVRKQKQAIKASETLPEIADEIEEEMPAPSHLQRAAHYMGHLLGVIRAPGR